MIFTISLWPALCFKKEQAEAPINLVIETMDQHFATKSDIRELKSSIRSELNDMRAEIADMNRSIRSEMRAFETNTNHRFEILESRMTLKLGGIMLAGIALLEYLR